MERRQEYEHAMASYSDSQSSEADREYSRSPTWSWDYGDEADGTDRPEEYVYANETYEDAKFKPSSHSKTTQVAPHSSDDVYSEFPSKLTHGQEEKRRSNGAYYRDHNGGYSGAYLGHHRAVDQQLNMSTEDFMKYHTEGASKALGSTDAASVPEVAV